VPARHSLFVIRFSPERDAQIRLAANYTGMDPAHMSYGPKPRENYLVIVLALAVVLGMAVALAVYFGWMNGVIPTGFDHPLTIVALVLCPPFVLSLIVAPGPEPGLVVVLVAGTIVFANAFLYGGVASGIYAIVSVVLKRRTSPNH
jgi:hypothetical protein